MRRIIQIGALSLCAVLLLAGCAAVVPKVSTDRIERLKRDIKKIRFAIRTTKTIVSRARGERYLPDLYMRLAELYVENARYYYHLAYEKQKEKGLGVVSVQSKMLKEKAIAVYRRLLALYPNYVDGDKAYFFMAHEMRELGDYEQMLKTYLELADKYPDSNYRLEGLLVVGDYYFDKAELDDAEKYYRQVIASPETRVHAMARYKLAWCYINRSDFKSTLEYFDGAIQAANRWLPRAGGKSRSGGNKIDLRREALVDSAYPFTEVRKPKEALQYFRERADSKTTYLAALAKLGNRYYVKQNWKATAEIYREVLSITGDTEDTIDDAYRLYEAVSTGKLYEHADSDVAAMINAVRRRYYNRTLEEKVRARLMDSFEKYTRDMATRLQDLANEKKDEQLLRRAADAYLSYLSFFKDSKHAAEVTANLAEALYAAKEYLRAARYYYNAGQRLQGKDRRDAIYTAVVAYFEALKQKEKLSRLQVVQARAGLRVAGRQFVELYPRDPQIVQVKFNIGRTFYDSGEFDEAIRLFTALVQQFPKAEAAAISARLVLDSFRNQEDFEGLIWAGKRFLEVADLGDPDFKKDVGENIKWAENQLLATATIDAADDERQGTGAEKLDEIAKEFKGTALECKALVNAFVAARSAADVDRVFEVGGKIRRACAKSEEMPEVMATMGKLAMDTSQFLNGIAYLSAAAKYKKGAEAAEMHRAVAAIQIGLGRREQAEESLVQYLSLGGAPGEVAELVVEIIRLHNRANAWNAAIGLGQRAMSSGISSPQVSYLLGYAFFRDGDMQQAVSNLEAAVAGGKGGEPAAREAAAAAQFYLGEITFRAFENMQLSNDLSQLAPLLQQKIALMTQTGNTYKGVVQIGSPVWSVAAMGRLAAVDAGGAEALRSLQLPAGLPEEAVKQVKNALEANAAPLAAEAKSAITQCGVIAPKFKELSASAKACLAGSAPREDPQGGVKPPQVVHTKPPETTALERILAKKPRDLATITKLAEVYLKGGDPYVAMLVIGKGMEIKETSELLNLLGVATARVGEHQDALSYFNKALDKEPGNLYALKNKAALLAQYGYTQAAHSAASMVPKGRTFSPSDPRLVPWAGGAQ